MKVSCLLKCRQRCAMACFFQSGQEVEMSLGADDGENDVRMVVRRTVVLMVRRVREEGCCGRGEAEVGWRRRGPSAKRIER